ncbi:MAG: hypothetical protein NZ739_11895 [Verrucomicrobiae bacterium]|nr:hypothetical protein [Verrucomicrobiae bacterium]
MIITNLLTNMVVLSYWGRVLTNTPEFEQYAFNTMFTNVVFIAERLGLDQSLITITQVSFFTANATPKHFSGQLVFGDRYHFKYVDGNFSAFTDLAYQYGYYQKPFWSNIIARAIATQDCSPALEDELHELAQSRLRSLGLPVEELGFLKPHTVLTETNLFGEGKKFCEYSFKYSTSNATIWVTVISETRDIAVLLMDLHPKYAIKLHRPTNYLELFGLSSNTVFVVELPTEPDKPRRYMILREE